MSGTIFRRILIHLYSCNGDLVQQEVACVKSAEVFDAGVQHHSCSDRTGFTALLSCAALFPSKIKSCTALQGRFAVVHFLPNCKTVSPSKQLSPKHYSLCAPCQTADQISLFFFFFSRGDCSCLFWAGIHFHQLQKPAEITSHV